jgi:hypothetical protein
MIQGFGHGRTGQGCGTGGSNQSSQGLPPDLGSSAGRCSPASGGAHLCRACSSVNPDGAASDHGRKGRAGPRRRGRKALARRTSGRQGALQHNAIPPPTCLPIHGATSCSPTSSTSRTASRGSSAPGRCACACASRRSTTTPAAASMSTASGPGSSAPIAAPAPSSPIPRPPARRPSPSNASSPEASPSSAARSGRRARRSASSTARPPSAPATRPGSSSSSTRTTPATAAEP